MRPPHDCDFAGRRSLAFFLCFRSYEQYRALMQDIFIYGDSLTWGIIPLTRKRFPFEQRWTGVLENKLNAGTRHVRVIEDALNGRRTVLDDPFKAGRNGLVGLAQRIEIHS